MEAAASSTASDPSTSCEHCGKMKRMMVAMVPGKDGVRWFLCPRCWEDGLQSMRVTKVITNTGVAVLPSTGERREWTETITTKVPAERASPAKEDVGNFARPRARARKAR